MILNIGIDIIEKNRIKILLKKYNKKFAKKILNKKEVQFLKKKEKIEFLSKKFTIKESLAKAIGIGFINGLSFKNIEICKTPLGKPSIKKTYNDIKTLISISHDKNITIALIIIFKKSKFN